jgi:predicted RNA-binding Zn-ribbon protein involved in translation (DUF1610 family)
LTLAKPARLEGVQVKISTKLHEGKDGRIAATGAICTNLKCNVVIPDDGVFRSNCPECGSFLIFECPHCGTDLPAHVREIRFCPACGATLRANRAPEIERRTHERIPSSIEAVVTEADVQTGLMGRSASHITDLGVGGCYVSTEDPFPRGTLVALHFGDEKRPLNCRALVIHSTPGEGMGLAFVETDSDQKSCFTEWLNELKGNPDVTIERAEKRSHLRIAVRMGAEVFEPRSGVHLHCLVTDLSVEGCHVETETTFRKGVRVVLHVMKEGLIFQTTAIVTRATNGKGMGLAFTDTAAAQEVTLVAWLREANTHTADTAGSLIARA